MMKNEKQMKKQVQSENENKERDRDKNLLDLELVNYEMVAAIVMIIAYIIVYISGLQTKEIIIERLDGRESPKRHPSASQLVALSGWLILISSTILATVAYTRLKEREQEILSGRSELSLIPNLNITTGFVLSVLANTIKAVGSQQRADQEAEITIL